MLKIHFPVSDKKGFAIKWVKEASLEGCILYGSSSRIVGKRHEAQLRDQKRTPKRSMVAAVSWARLSRQSTEGLGQ